MAKRNATTKQTSGGGYPFENEVVAYVLAYLLNRSSPFEPPGGFIETVQAQKPATEWHLDDLLLTVRSQGRRHRLAFSIKSNAQVSANGFPPDFIRAAWEQLLHHSSPAFDEGCDYLGLITVPAAPGLKKAIFELFGLAREQVPSSLAVEIGLPNRTNDTVRKLFKSAERPEDLATKHGVGEGNAGRLLRHMIWMPFDFEDENSERRTQALALCRNLLRSGSVDEAQALWGRLKEIADYLRRFGGGIDLGGLVGKLRGRFELRDFPDQSADWERLSEDTVSALNRVRSTIGGTVTLPRLPEHEAVDQAFVEHQAVILLGASGSGKSAIARRKAESAMAAGRVLWYDASRLSARSLAEWRTHLGLSHGLGEIIHTAPVANALLVLDELDRVYSSAGFATAAEFVRAVRLDEETSPWRVLITCTPEAWDRVRRELGSHGGFPPTLEIVNIGPPDAEELTKVWSAFPQLRSLMTHHHLAPVLLRPKVLDLLANRTRTDEDLATVGESHLAKWFWDREVAYGTRAALRAEAARRFAEYLADTLNPDISLSYLTTAVGEANVPGIDELREGRVLRLADGRVTFDHDLYADWIRARQLVDVHERGQLTNFLAPRLGSPVWHRAVRLFGVHLLEQSDDLSLWRSAFKTAEKISAPAGILAQDILLESTTFSSASAAGLFRDGLWPLLAERGGHLLERLLNRLFHTATIPNPAVLEVIARQAPELEIYAASGARLPYPFYWFGILALLHAHRGEIPARVRGVTARVADLWLRSTPREWPFRKEAAALAVALGEALLKDKEENHRLFLEDEADQQVYRAVLASGHEEPEAVTQIVLEAAGRRKRRYAPPPLSEEELAARRAKYRESAVWSLAVPSGPFPDPWPHGPAFRVDGSLQKTVLEGDALQPLTEALPQVAREALLALLISEPKRRSFNDDPYHDRLALEWPRWYPTFYTQGPFRSFLATVQPEAITAILQLVDHATDRWDESCRRYLARIRELSPREVETPTLPIQVDGQERDYIGDADVFRWCQHGPDSGGVIGTTLAALEKHLYDRVDAGEDVTPLIQRLLTESRSLAIVGLLSVFGRRHLHYLRGPLRGLLVSPHILAWTLMGSVSSTWEMALSVVPKPLREEYRAWHELPHRKTSLRDFALFLFLNDTSLRPLFRKARKVLLRGLQPGGPYENWSFVENLVAQLDPSNYSKFKGEDGRSYKEYSPPEELRKKHAEMDEGLEAKRLLMMLPFECRQLLDSAEPIPEETLDRLWASAQQIIQLDPDEIDDVSPPVNALAGVAAVFVQRGETWLSGYPERSEWSQRTIREVGQEDRETSAFHAFQWDRRAFAAETLPILWAKDPDDKALREIVGRMVLNASPELVGTITARAATVRERLGDDHLRLLRFVLLRAGLTSRIRHAEDRASWTAAWNEVGPALGGDQDEPAGDAAHTLRSELEAVKRAFVERTLKAAVPSLEEVAPLQPLGEQRTTRRPHRRRARYRLIEESLLTATYRGVPYAGDDKNLWLPVWERIVLDTVEPLVLPDDEQTEDLEDLEDLPGVWGQYIMAQVADIVAVTEDSAVARRLWQPIIDLGATASQWVSLFARYWAAYALFQDAREPVIEFWIAMIDSALANPRWTAGEGYTAESHRSGELWRALFGFGNMGADVWTKELRPRVWLLRSRLATWAKSHLANPDNVRALAQFLTYPAAADLLLEGVIWLDGAFQTFGDRFWGSPGQSNRVEDAVLSLLAHIWRTAQDALRRNELAFVAFRNLLQSLVSRQHAAALELADRVGSVVLR